MKLIGFMSLEIDKTKVRKIFEKHNVQIYSEVGITGHTAETIKEFGFWHLERDLPIYSTLYFAIIHDEKAEEIFNEIDTTADDFDAQHPPRLFMVNVEKMV
jgi:hypothetical protein